jgi:CTP synthase
VCSILRLSGEPDLAAWRSLVERIEAAELSVRIGLVGKYVVLPDAYLSVVEALRHAGFHLGADVEVTWIESEGVAGLLAEWRLRDLDGIVIPGGFGERGVEGKVAAAGYARENDIPCLGLCLGLQVMVIDVARNLAGLAGANSRELDPASPHPVIDLMDEQRDVVNLGGTMRLGSYVARLQPGSVVEKAYGEPVVFERHRHRYEVNPRYRRRLEDAGLRCSGTSPDDRLVEFVEFPGHPFWVGTQAHPEFKSRPDRPHPLFFEFVGSALDRAESRNPHLPDL